MPGKAWTGATAQMASSRCFIGLQETRHMASRTESARVQAALSSPGHTPQTHSCVYKHQEICWTFRSSKHWGQSDCPLGGACLVALCYMTGCSAGGKITRPRSPTCATPMNKVTRQVIEETALRNKLGGIQDRIPFTIAPNNAKLSGW